MHFITPKQVQIQPRIALKSFSRILSVFLQTCVNKTNLRVVTGRQNVEKQDFRNLNMEWIIIMWSLINLKVLLSNKSTSMITLISGIPYEGQNYIVIW